MSCHSLFQEIFLTQGLNPGLPHYRQTLYRRATREVQGVEDSTIHSLLQSLLSCGVGGWRIQLPGSCSAMTPLDSSPSSYTGGQGRQRRRLDSGALCSALFCPVLWQGSPGVASGAQHSAPAQAWSWQGDREIALFIVPGESGFLKPV